MLRDDAPGAQLSLVRVAVVVVFIIIYMVVQHTSASTRQGGLPTGGEERASETST